MAWLLAIVFGAAATLFLVLLPIACGIHLIKPWIISVEGVQFMGTFLLIHMGLALMSLVVSWVFLELNLRARINLTPEWRKKVDRHV